MARQAFARRYAQAAFEIASERKELDKWLADLKKAAVLFQNNDLQAFLESPKIGFSEKSRIITRLLAGVDPMVLNFLHVLVLHEHAHLMGDVVNEYSRFLDINRGVDMADVTTAVPLSDGERQNLERSLSQAIGKKVTVIAHVNPAIIGGMVARVGGKLIDGSVRTKLDNLKKDIGGAAA